MAVKTLSKAQQAAIASLVRSQKTNPVTLASLEAISFELVEDEDDVAAASKRRKSDALPDEVLIPAIGSASVEVIRSTSSGMNPVPEPAAFVGAACVGSELQRKLAKARLRAEGPAAGTAPGKAGSGCGVPSDDQQRARHLGEDIGLSGSVTFQPAGEALSGGTADYGANFCGHSDADSSEEPVALGCAAAGDAGSGSVGIAGQHAESAGGLFAQLLDSCLLKGSADRIVVDLPCITGKTVVEPDGFAAGNGVGQA